MTVSKFKVGDRVYAPFHDCGIVTKITNDDTYPIEVTWEVSRYKYGDDISTFTPDGFLFLGSKRDWTRITHVGKALEGDSKFHVKDEEAAINPAYYQVEGIPEVIEIMQHLMTKEQLEGFLWGNIIKYVYRYGRKGDKKETAGKIEWYARKLKEVLRDEG
mgnify:CR=1 FL=1